jgi:hypothetical protein
MPSPPFRIPLKNGLAIYAAPGKLISVRGLPGGDGKIRLHKNAVSGEKMTAARAVYRLKDKERCSALLYYFSTLRSKQ